MGIGRFVYTPILPFMVETLGLSQAQAGLVASANFLGYLLGALGAAKASLPGGRRRWFLIALAVSAFTTAGMAAEAWLPLFLALRFASGVASAFVLVLASALVLDRLAAAGRPGLSALHFAGVGSGIALSAVLVAGMAAFGSDWRELWLASGGLSLLALLAVFRLVPPEGAEAAAAKPPAAGHGDRRRLIALVIAYGLFGFGYVITATFISTLVRLTPEIRWLESYVWLVVGLAAIPSVLVWSWLAGRLGTARGFALACLTQGVGVALSVLGSGAFAVLLAAALLGGTIMGITALGLVYARALSPGDPRRSMALMTAAFGLGQMIGPGFAGYAYGLGQSFLLPSLVASAALFIAFALTMEWRRR
ncbi:YbfB/YjiJ family MFS transporter [Pelagibius litoralis]|uniref:YbfB/YjiJ family MFS transporter n=2 Tax=Pelagibius litoralis TaxID=374515 RepID=A0A967KGS7_9PROT|nr:YbfB/YjiJ family MFS transporter [Pelagibius litoralis]